MDVLGPPDVAALSYEDRARLHPGRQLDRSQERGRGAIDTRKPGKERFMCRTLCLVLASVVTLTLLPALAQETAGGQVYRIDSVHSSAVFRIKHLDVSYFWGRFNDISGTATWDAARPEATSFDVRVNANSIDSKDAKRNTHLKGPDFFDTKKYRTLPFKSTSARKLDDTTIEVTGDLTLRGVTRPLTAKVEFTGAGKGMQGEAMVGFETTFTIKRSDFGINFAPDALGDDVRVIVSLEAHQAPPPRPAPAK
ncbi:MAG: YceI family protein [Planctomycetes bacterium]|nr:YceI family protein [Planctomycetota bacterium]